MDIANSAHAKGGPDFSRPPRGSSLHPRIERVNIHNPDTANAVLSSVKVENQL